MTSNATPAGRRQGGLTTWAKYKRLPGGRKRLPRFSEDERKGRAARGGWQNVLAGRRKREGGTAIAADPGA